MTTPRDIAVLVGSLRKESFNLRMAKALIPIALPELALEIVPIGELALYNQDLEASPPEPWVAFRERIRAAAGVLFVTPEYNRSVPGVLKNAIDVGSRPYGKSAWARKPAAIISVSPGKLGAFGANHHLRQSLVFLDMPVLQQPEAYVGGAEQLFDANGGLVPNTRDFMSKFLKAYSVWIDHLARE